MASAIVAASSVQISFEDMSAYSTKHAPTLNGVDESLFDSLEESLAAFKNGEFLVVMDDHNRENEGDLICAASMMTTEKMAWFIKHTRYSFRL